MPIVKSEVAQAFLDDLAVFEQQCEDEQYTDSGEAWQFIDRAKKILAGLPNTGDEPQPRLRVTMTEAQAGHVVGGFVMPSTGEYREIAYGSDFEMSFDFKGFGRLVRVTMSTATWALADKALRSVGWVIPPDQIERLGRPPAQRGGFTKVMERFVAGTCRVKPADAFGQYVVVCATCDGQRFGPYSTKSRAMEIAVQKSADACAKCGVS